MLALLVPLWSGPALAFGPSGHRYVGYVAGRYLCAETRAALEPLLAEKSMPGRSLAQAGVWPDTIRGLPEWRHSGPWHYINVDDHGSLRAAVRQAPDNVLSALGRFESTLRDTSLPVPERAIALRFVVHLIADVHQPLHVGRAADRGGNRIPVRLANGSGKQMLNLHQVWDGQWLWAKGASGPRVVAGQLPLRSRRTVRRWQAGTVLDWAQESLALRARIYRFEAPEPGAGGSAAPIVLSPAYLEDTRAVLNKRLELAGVRVAGRLDAALGAPPGCQPEVASRHATL